jgi:ferredoxin
MAFSFDVDTKVVIAPDIPEDYLDKVRFACESCPTGALRIEGSEPGQ